jgi:glycerol-3-phosphate dehydrogenase
VDAFVSDINNAIPGLSLDAAEITRLFCGLLPAADATGQGLAVRPQIYDHGKTGGPAGLFSVSGVKLTTARRVAAGIFDEMTGRSADTGRLAAAKLARQADERLDRAGDWDLATAISERRMGHAEVKERLARLTQDESVVYREDLFLRRTTLWELDEEALNSLPNAPLPPDKLGTLEPIDRARSERVAEDI